MRKDYLKKIPVHELFPAPAGQTKQMIIAEHHHSIIIQLKGDEYHGQKCLLKPPVTLNKTLIGPLSLHRLTTFMGKFGKL